MEPRAAQVRRRERLGRQQKDRPSREGEPCSGGAGRPGGIGGNVEMHRGPDLVQWTQHMQAVKTQLLEQAQGQLMELLDQAMWEAVQAYPPQGRPVPSVPPDSLHKTREPSLGKRKVFIIRKSLLDELMEVPHFRTIYHMFVAGLCVFIISTLAIDLIDEGRLMMEFDLLTFSFGQLPLALVTWVPMFLSTLLVPYQALRLWERPQSGGAWTLGVGLGCLLLAAHTVVLGILPVHVAVEYQLPPASRCVLVFEQVRLLMKSYSFLRETVPGTLRARGGEGIRAPSFSSYLYFLFCPTLIYRETYPRGGTRQNDGKHTVSIPLLQQDTQRQVELCGQELCPGPGLRALRLFHPGPPLCSCLCQHEPGAFQHPCPGALHHACHLARHFYAAAHLLCLPSLLAQRLRRDATIWRQNVLSGGAWTWATWELDARRAREGCRGGWWLCWFSPCYQTRCICPILTKSNTEIPRFTAEKRFLQQGSQVRRSENKLRFASPKAKGLRYLQDKESRRS
ncbi:sterol O-acyltransferase 2 isoform X5 [Ovis aries]|uniref:sterol O-acyltransferase 2 isoform X5 n=1 Tax=Ovis aries TaxID=9940 RepID=UPI001C2EC7BC|nr:sterol O-acyltransferase 2 isoform X5 [Ovis aries]